VVIPPNRLSYTLSISAAAVRRAATALADPNGLCANTEIMTYVLIL
jgi:hypothetical protein